MIATVDVQVTASNPTIPLFPWRTFRKSLTSLRIRNVPKRIGNWSISSVSISATYPDNQIITHDCTLVGGVWIATMPSCDVAGNVSRGYAVIARGKDESGNDAESYILGRGDIYVIDADIKTTAILKTYNVTLLPTKPDNPNDGDIWLDGGVWYIHANDTTSTLGLSKDDVTEMLDDYVPSTRRVNGKSLDSDINFTASDIGALGDTGKLVIRSDFPVGGGLYIKGGQAGGGTIDLGGGMGGDDAGPRITMGDDQQYNMASGASIDMYSGSASGAEIKLHDSMISSAKSEITIGDIKVRESITNINDKLSPVTGTLDTYIKQVVTSTYANANTKEY